MINFILTLLIIIVILMMIRNIRINTNKMEDFSQNMQGTLCSAGTFASLLYPRTCVPAEHSLHSCSDKKYSLEYLYTQPCIPDAASLGIGVPQTKNFCEPYYIPPLIDKTKNMFYYFNKDYLGGEISH